MGVDPVRLSDRTIAKRNGAIGWGGGGESFWFTKLLIQNKGAQLQGYRATLRHAYSQGIAIVEILLGAHTGKLCKSPTWLYRTLHLQKSFSGCGKKGILPEGSSYLELLLGLLQEFLERAPALTAASDYH